MQYTDTAFCATPDMVAQKVSHHKFFKKSY